VMDRAERKAKVDAGVDLLLSAHAHVGGDVVSAGGTGTWDVHDRITELQAGSYALMDSAYSAHPFPFAQALRVVGTVISATAQWAVADVGLKALGMDHGNPTIDGHSVWFCSDEHITFSPNEGSTIPKIGDRQLVVPAHVDPTMAMHEAAWLVRGDEILDRWAIDLRGW
jgi:D-threonine aldolase